MRRLLLFIPTLLFSTCIFCQQTAMSPVQIAERNKPGTVMIQSTFKGTVSAIVPEVDQAALETMALQVKDELTAQGNFTTDKFWNVYIMTFCRDISKYMMKGSQTVSEELNTTMLGSGFIVTPDGYVVTNCHVVDENDEVTKMGFAQEAFTKILAADIETIEGSMNRKMTAEEKAALNEAYSWYYSQTMDVGNMKKEFNVVMGITGDKGKIVPLIIPAKLVTKGEPIPGKDVAILKLTKNHTYPTIRIGDDQSMRVGETVYVLGYPGVATYHPLLSEETISEATLTRGLISAKKNMKGGWGVLQTDAAVTHGNSGGPVMNDKGEVIGLATFGSADFQRGQEVQGLNFIVPSTIVNEFIDKADIEPKMSDISLLYEEAMSFYDKERYKKALEKFNEVKEMNPSFPFVEEYITHSEKSIEKGLDKEPKGTSPMVFYMGAVALALLIILFYFIKRRQKPGKG